MTHEDSNTKEPASADAAQKDEAYERAKEEALEFLKTGFHMGGYHPFNRDELHERWRE